MEFLARVNPRVAIVTGGAGGFGNLPSPETLERLHGRGIPVFRSDVDGATTVQMRDSSSIHVTEPYRPSDGVSFHKALEN
jgi:beta-lactamase superfamily II metal-dependent hydrolase